LARKFGLAGKDDFEEAKVDEIADFHNGVHEEIRIYFAVFAGFKEGDKEALHKNIFAPGIKNNFPIYERLLKESGSGFLVRSGLTWVDFVVSEFFNTISYMDPELWKQYSDLEEYRKRVQSLPQIKKYIESRKYSVV